MATCGNIALSLGFNCNVPLQGGTADRAYIMNHEDWKAAAIGRDLANNLVVESVVLAGSATAFYVDGKNNSNAPAFQLVKLPYADVYDHTFNYLVFDISNAAHKALANQVGGRYVVIAENNYQGASGQCAFEIYGADAGLEVKVFTRDALNNDNQGAYVLNLATPDVGKEPNPPLRFFDTDYATTKAALEALLA